MHLWIAKKISFSEILGEGLCLSDYARNPALFSSFLHFEPRQVEEKINSLAHQPFPGRQSLMACLTTYHQNLQAPAETLKNIALLDNPRTLVVLTGQQPGLLTGPLYTIYKTISCLRQARNLEQTYGRPCVPVFWIASEDHNLEEVTSIFLPSPSGDEYRKLSFHPQRGHFKRPAGLLPLPEKRLGPFMREVKEILSPLLHFEEMASILKATLEHSLTLGEWFARLMLSLFKPYGLVIVDPVQAGIKQLIVPLWDRILPDPLALPELVDAAGRRLEQRGYRRQLVTYPSRCPFFLYEKGCRERVMWDGQAFHTRNQKYSPEQVWETAHLRPECLSPNVYLRPIVSEYLFPTLLYLAGPGETGYFVQIKEVYEYFGLKMPIVYPRLSATVQENPSCGLILKPGSLQGVGLQERKLNVWYLLSRYGLEFLTALYHLPVEDYCSHLLIEVFKG
ncbi:MAG: bacillithiol biosynthesis cysteine-adding enzyme BshC [bacterium]